jgi:hypothetical protein
MNRFAIHSLVAAASGLAAMSASAHISYSGRDFGIVTLATNTTIANQTVTSNYGWADASDTGLVFDSALALSRSDPTLDSTPVGVGIDNLYLGDSHKGRAFRFHLDTSLDVVVTASAKANATITSVGGLLPGFSIYQGLAAIAPFAATQTALPVSPDHDFAAASEAYRSALAAANYGSAYGWGATQGSWNALGDWKIGGDGDLPGAFGQLSSFHYVGSAAETGGSNTVTGSFLLGPGDYTIFVGGNDISNKGSALAAKAFGVSLSLSALPVPEPESWLLLALGLPALLLRRRAAR